MSSTSTWKISKLTSNTLYITRVFSRDVWPPTTVNAFSEHRATPQGSSSPSFFFSSSFFVFLATTLSQCDSTFPALAHRLCARLIDHFPRPLFSTFLSSSQSLFSKYARKAHSHDKSNLCVQEPCCLLKAFFLSAAPGGHWTWEGEKKKFHCIHSCLLCATPEIYRIPLRWSNGTSVWSLYD